MAKAQGELRTAQTRLADTSAAYDLALERYNSVIESATQLEALATEAAATAHESTRLFLLAARDSDSKMGPFDALLGLTPGEELLDRLGTIDQLSQASEDPEAASARADRDINRAEALRVRADAAQLAIADIPMATLKADRDAASAAVTTAQAKVTSLQLSATAATAATSLTELPPLPNDDGRLSGQAWVLPASGSITDSYGPRPSRPAGAGEFHYGTDIGSGCHAWILAASAGTVISAGYNGGLGNWILIDHGQGITTGYGHIEDGGIVVSVGDTVVAGQGIALAGSTGMSTGCHVHVEVSIDGVRTDAVPFFAARGVGLG